MKRTISAIIATTLIIALASGCDKKKSQYAGPIRPPSIGSLEILHPPGEASRPTQGLPNADSSVPLANYIKLREGKQLMFMYYALAGVHEGDYEKIAESYSEDYRTTNDRFKKRDVLNALKPRIDGEIEKAKNNCYFVHTTNGPSVVGHYNFNVKAFPVAEKVWAPDSFCSFSGGNAYYSFSYTNGEEFKAINEENTEVARQIEGIISGTKDFKLQIYAFAQDADPNRKKIRAQIVKMQLTDVNGNDLLKR